MSPIATGDMHRRLFMENTTLRPVIRMTVACDASPRGFHFDWVGMEAAQQVNVLGQSICGGCLIDGVAYGRWPLGSKSKPPSGRRRACIGNLAT